MEGLDSERAKLISLSSSEEEVNSCSPKDLR